MHRERLNTLGRTILAEDDPEKLAAACRALYELFAEAGGLAASAGASALENGAALAGGLAIAPADAARCLLDFRRTAVFLRGVRAALAALAARFPGAPLEVVYAGCGPFAPLVAPLLPDLAPSAIALTLIDYHEFSTRAVRRVFDACGLADFAPRVVTGDAAAYAHPRPVHLAVCETMQHALEREPQAAITFNLAPQLAPGGVFVPQKIEVEAAFAALDERFVETARAALGPLLTLDAARIAAGARPATRGLEFPVPPAAAAGGLDFLRLHTRVEVFGPHRLEEDESGLTCPKILARVDGLANRATIEFAYLLNESPRFEYRLR